MVIENHVIQSAAKNLPSSRLDVEHMRFVDKLVRGPIAFVAASVQRIRPTCRLYRCRHVQIARTVRCCSRSFVGLQ